MAIELVTPPATEPVSTADIKTHLRIDHSDEDSYLATLGSVARRHVEQITWRALITQTWRMSLREFPCSDSPIVVPRAPLQSVTSISYTDDAGGSQTWDAADYDVDTVVTPGTIEPGWGESYPSTREEPGAVLVTYVAGFGDSASDVPADLVHAIKILVADMYCRRESQIAPGMTTVDALLSAWMVRDQRLIEFV